MGILTYSNSFTQVGNGKKKNEYYIMFLIFLTVHLCLVLGVWCPIVALMMINTSSWWH